MSAETDAARSWVDGVNRSDGLTGGWRLEVISKRHSAVPGREIPTKIRRFARGVPSRLVKAAIECLLSDAPYSGILYNGEHVPGTYRPTLTTWVRDDQHRVDGQSPGTYTLVQDLVEDGFDDSAGAVTSKTCSEEATTEWTWDAVDIGELPDQTRQGYGYSVQSVYRQEDGTYNYALVTRHALTQASEDVVSECDAFHTVYTSSYENVYGSDGDFRDHLGARLPIPSPCDRTDGTAIAVQVAQNPDCTYRITVRREVSVPSAVSETGCERDAFSHGDRTVTRASSAPVDHAPGPGGGKTYSVEAVLRPDGRYDVSRKTVTEQRVTSAQRTVQRTLRGVVETVTDRNVADGTAEVVDIGDRVQVEKTPGGLYNRTVSKVLPVSVGDTGSQCETTIFQHQHSSLENVRDRPEAEAPVAGGGQTHQVSARATDEGTWDVTRTDVTELPVQDAQRTVQKTIHGIVETVTHRNVSDGSADVTDVGDRVQVEKTPGGLYNRTVTRVRKTSEWDAIGRSCQQSYFSHSHSTVSSVSDETGVEVGAAGQNVEASATTRRTEDGTWEVESRTTTYKWLDGSYVNVHNPTRRVVTRLFKNMPNPPPMDTRKTKGVVIDTSVSVNEHGSYDGRYVTTYAEEVKDTVVSNVRNVTQDVKTHSFRNAKDPHSVTASTGTVVTSSVSMNEFGCYDGEYRVTTARRVPEFMTARYGNVMQEVEARAFQNEKSPVSVKANPGETVTASASRNEFGLFDGGYQIVRPREFVSRPIPSGSGSVRVENTVYRNCRGESDAIAALARSVSEDGQVTSVSASVNEAGLYDLSVSKKTRRALKTWDVEASLGMVYSYTVNFEYATKAEYKDIVRNLEAKCVEKVMMWTELERGPSTTDFSPNVSMDDMGFYSGRVTFSARWSNGSAGLLGKTNQVDFSYSYTVRTNTGIYTTHFAQGRGKQKLREFMNGASNVSGMSCSFDPATSVWSANYVNFYPV